MRIQSQSIQDGKPIDRRFAFGIPDPDEHMALGKNISPHLVWEDLPEGTKSLALICHDPDAPSRFDVANQEGQTVPASLSRVDFFHWILLDIDPGLGQLREGDFSREVTPKGKHGPDAPHGTRVGINTYTSFMAGDPDMGGTYWSYDGPCPPWNDEIPHRYVFTLYALDIERVPVEGEFDGNEVRDAIADHILAEASITGTYSLNPDVPA